MEIFKFENVYFSYSKDSNWVLNDINFSIREGEFVIILGHNGCGKTTLLKHFNTLLKPSKGKVYFKGKDINDYSQEIFYHVGFLFQDPNDQIFSSTVEQDVAFGPLNMGLKREEIEERVEKALKTVGMWELRKEKIHHLSFGQKQRVAIAGVLANNPSVLVFDEPTSALDPATQIDIMNLLVKLNRENGKTIVMTTHDVEYIAEYSNRIMVISRGKIIYDGIPNDIFKNQEITSASNLRLPLVSILCVRLAQEKNIPLKSIPLTLDECMNFIRTITA